MKSNVKETLLMSQCSRFDSCNAPKCPLDFSMKKRTKNTDEETCTMTRNILKRIAGQNIKKLPWIENYPNRNVRRARNIPVIMSSKIVQESSTTKINKTNHRRSENG
jgi:hypothetical protein